MNKIAQNQPASRKIVPLKIGLFGEQGTGKTTTAALIAAAISKQYHGGAPVWVTDPELGWQFPKRRIFSVEGIEVQQRTIPTFKAMQDDLRAAEKAGACVYAVELAKPWMDLLRTVQSRCGDRWGQELVKLWGDWVNLFLNSPLHCLALARVSDITEDVQTELGDIKRVKVAEGMKAGGQRNNFGYEPHFVGRMTLERSPRRKKGKVIEDEGRMIHRCDVLKDRTWALNGLVFRWRDRSEYKPGEFDAVWKAFAPHFAEIQASEGVQLDTAATSNDLISDDGSSLWIAEQREKERTLEETANVIKLMFGGRDANSEKIRIRIMEQVWNVRAWSRVEALPIDDIRDGKILLEALLRRFREDPPSNEDMLWETLRQARKDVSDPSNAENTTLVGVLEESIKNAKAARTNGGHMPPPNDADIPF